MPTGTVRTWHLRTNPKLKPFGFLKPDDGDADVYIGPGPVEEAGLKGLKAGDRIEYESEPGRIGLRIKTLKLIEEGGRAA
jgi:cold shock protein